MSSGGVCRHGPVSQAAKRLMLRFASRRVRHLNDAPERIDVATRVPKTKEECEHLARYLWAAAQVHGEVLDVACGTGYGAKVLAHHARVSGVDRDKQAVGTARFRGTRRVFVAQVPPNPLSCSPFALLRSFADA